MPEGAPPGIGAPPAPCPSLNFAAHCMACSSASAGPGRDLRYFKGLPATGKSTCTKTDTRCTFPDMQASTPSRGRVLIVDDNPDVLTAARLALTPHFEKVQTMDTPSKFANLVGGFSPHAVLLDMNFAPGARSGREGLCLERDSIAATSQHLRNEEHFRGVRRLRAKTWRCQPGIRRRLECSAAQSSQRNEVAGIHS